MAGERTAPATPDEPGRDETPIERLDRNWADLLQEVRVVQTGVQLLTGFLLTLPFQNRFSSLTTTERTIYLATASASITATAFLEAPVSLHRALFRRHRRFQTVQIAHRLSILGIAFLALAVIGVATLIFAVVLGQTAGLLAGVGAIVVLTLLWVALPLVSRRRESFGDDA